MSDQRQPVDDRRRAGFTLTELLIVLTIIGILAGLALSALAGAAEQARIQRTRSIISKIDQLLAEKWDSYRTRAVPIRMPANVPPLMAARIRLYGIRELQRMELPDRRSDVINTSSGAAQSVALSGLGLPRSSVGNAYFRMVQSGTSNNPMNWSASHQGSECLYMILATTRDGDKSALDYFSPAEVGDSDQDGMPEILDAWGTPIEFLRWAPGYRTDANPLVVSLQARSAGTPDVFDPVKIDPRVCQTAVAAYSPMPATSANTDPSDDTFALYPLVFSAGPDKLYEIEVNVIDYVSTNPPNDPYTVPSTGSQAGTVSSTTGWVDNVTNHYQETN